MTIKYEVQTRFVFDKWENCWHINDKLETFDSIEQAQAEINDAIRMNPEGSTQADYRINMVSIKEDMKL